MSLYTHVKVAVMVTDWMWFPQLQRLGQVTLIGSCVVAIAMLCEVCSRETHAVTLGPQTLLVFIEETNPFVG